MKKMIFLSLFLVSPLMADSITITFPDGERNRINRAFAETYGWTPTIDDPQNPGRKIQNPETKGQFAKRMLSLFVKEVVASVEVKEASNAAAETARNNANALDVQ